MAVRTDLCKCVNNLLRFLMKITVLSTEVAVLLSQRLTQGSHVSVIATDQRCAQVPAFPRASSVLQLSSSSMIATRQSAPLTWWYRRPAKAQQFATCHSTIGNKFRQLLLQVIDLIVDGLTTIVVTIVRSIYRFQAF